MKHSLFKVELISYESIKSILEKNARESLTVEYTGTTEYLYNYLKLYVSVVALEIFGYKR